MKPVVRAIAESRGFSVSWIRETYNDGRTRSDWVLLSKATGLFDLPALREGRQPIPDAPQQRVWTDDFNTLWKALH